MAAEDWLERLFQSRINPVSDSNNGDGNIDGDDVDVSIPYQSGL